MMSIVFLFFIPVSLQIGPSALQGKKKHALTSLMDIINTFC